MKGKIEGSELKNSRIDVTVTDAHCVSEDIYLGAGNFTILNQQNEILEQGKWGNVFKFDNGQIKYLMESAHRELKDVDTSVAEITLKNSITSEALHFDKIVRSIENYISNYNSKNSDGTQKAPRLSKKEQKKQELIEKALAS